MSTMMEHAPFTGAILPILKQSGVRQLCEQMVKAGIIPDIQTVGFSNGISGFIYNSDIVDIYKKHEFAIDALVDEYADSIDNHPLTVIAEIGAELSFNGAYSTDIVKTITAVDYLGELMREYGTVRTTLTDTQGYEIELSHIQWETFTTMRQNDDYDLIDAMLTRNTGGDFELTVDNEHQLKVVSVEENDTTGEITRTEYTVDFYVELCDQHICIL